MKSLHHIIIITLIERGLGGLMFIYCAHKNLPLLECCHQVVPACSKMLPLRAFQKLHCPLYPPRDADFYRSRNNLSKRALMVTQRLLNTMLVVERRYADTMVSK